jgi:hypothetical protein
MSLNALVSVIGWVSVINYVVLIIWFLIFISAKTWYYKLTSKWFKISEEKFDAINYVLMGIYDLSIFAFFVVPYIALRIVL